MSVKRKSKGQTLVEFALVLPVLLLLFFGIIEMSFYVYAWSNMQFASRRAAEEATQRQPRDVMTANDYRNNVSYFNSDPCLQSILQEARHSGALNNDLQINQVDIHLSFYKGTTDSLPDGGTDAHQQGNVVEVNIQKEIQPLTPLLSMIDRDHTFQFNAFSRRTIIANGSPYPDLQPWPDGRTADFKNCVFLP